jgi:hypothetical protein
MELLLIFAFLGLLYLPPQSRHPFLKTLRDKGAMALAIQTAYLALQRTFDCPPHLRTLRDSHGNALWAVVAAGIATAVLLVPPRTRRIGAWAAGALAGVELGFAVLAARTGGGWEAWLRVAVLPLYPAWALWSARKAALA